MRTSLWVIALMAVATETACIKPVNTVPEFMTAFKQSTGKGALLLLYREGRTRYLVLGK